MGNSINCFPIIGYYFFTFFAFTDVYVGVILDSLLFAPVIESITYMQGTLFSHYKYKRKIYQI